MEFSEKLKLICKETGISLKKINDLTGISYATLKFYSQGRRQPKIENIRAIAEIPEFEAFKELLLDTTKLTAEDSEIMILVGRLRARGREADVIEILRDLEAQPDANAE